MIGKNKSMTFEAMQRGGGRGLQVPGFLILRTMAIAAGSGSALPSARLRVKPSYSARTPQCSTPRVFARAARAIVRKSASSTAAQGLRHPPAYGELIVGSHYLIRGTAVSAAPVRTEDAPRLCRVSVSTSVI